MVHKIYRLRELGQKARVTVLLSLVCRIMWLLRFVVLFTFQNVNALYYHVIVLPYYWQTTGMSSFSHLALLH